ncbi:MAG: competence protein ComK [Bacillota bacterium]
MVILRRYIIKEKMRFLVDISRGSKGYTLVSEGKREFLVEKSPEEIIEETCNYYGFDFPGALKAAAKILENDRPGAFIVNPNETVCLLSSRSPLRADSYFINVQHIQFLEGIGYGTKVFFDAEHIVTIPTRKVHLLARKNAAEKLRRVILERNIGSKSIFNRPYSEYYFCRETGIYMLNDDDYEE